MTDSKRIDEYLHKAAQVGSGTRPKILPGCRTTGLDYALNCRDQFLAAGIAAYSNLVIPAVLKQ